MTLPSMSGIIMWSPGMSLEDIEKQVILKAYGHYRQNKTVTANSLGISVRTLDTRIEKYEQDQKELELREEQRRRDREELLKRSRGVPNPNPTLASAAPATPPNSGSANTQAGGKAVSGNGVQPASDASKEFALPVQEREQVQKVLPQQAPVSGPRRGR